MTHPKEPSDVWGTRLQLTMASEPLKAPLQNLSAYVAVFHDWIRRGATEDLLIDVVSYEHVPAGPGVLLLGHEVDYAIRQDDALAPAADLPAQTDPGRGGRRLWPLSRTIAPGRLSLGNGRRARRVAALSTIRVVAPQQ